MKLVSGEPERDELRAELARWAVPASSALTTVEVTRACTRYGPVYEAAAGSLLRTVALVPIDDAVLRAAAALEPATLRTLDAIHLATALSLGADLGVLVAYDRRLLDAAGAQGLATVSPSP